MAWVVETQPTRNWIHWLLRDSAYEPYVTRVGLSPKGAPSHRISLEPVFLRNLSSGFRIAGGMAIITPAILMTYRALSSVFLSNGAV